MERCAYEYAPACSRNCVVARFGSGSGAGLWAISNYSQVSELQPKYERARRIRADCIGVLHRPAEVDVDGFKNEGNALRSQKRVDLGGSAKLFADGRNPVNAACLNEAN
jgi:hypothetical protein